METQPPLSDKLFLASFSLEKDLFLNKTVSFWSPFGLLKQIVGHRPMLYADRPPTSCLHYETLCVTHQEYLCRLFRGSTREIDNQRVRLEFSMSVIVKMKPWSMQ